MTTLLWMLAVVLILVGIAGVVLPALPGVVFVFGGILLAAWIDDFALISGWTVGLLGVLAAVAFVVDYVASTVAAKRAGASKQGLIGAALVGAAIGEFIAQRDAIRAGQIGVATWIGLLVGTVLKLAIVFTMIGVFIAALLI